MRKRRLPNRCCGWNAGGSSLRTVDAPTSLVPPSRFPWRRRHPGACERDGPSWSRPRRPFGAGRRTRRSDPCERQVPVVLPPPVRPAGHRSHRTRSAPSDGDAENDSPRPDRVLARHDVPRRRSAPPQHEPLAPHARPCSGPGGASSTRSAQPRQAMLRMEALLPRNQWDPDEWTASLTRRPGTTNPSQRGTDSRSGALPDTAGDGPLRRRTCRAARFRW